MHLCTSSEPTHQQDQKAIVQEQKSKLQGNMHKNAIKGRLQVSYLDLR